MQLHGHKKRRVLMNSFIISHFSYYHLASMFHCRTLNNQINKVQVKALRLVYKDETVIFFDHLLKETNQ